VGAIAESVDPYLNVLRPFDAENRPNENHQLLASLAVRGHYVFTTNFDGLIETALGPGTLRPAATASDYSRVRRGEIAPDDAIFKLHGSWRDGCGRLRGGSIQATIERVARNAVRGSSGSPALSMFREIVRERHLVIVGYSGWDDFDIVEALLTTDSDMTLVWVDHCQQGAGIVREADDLRDELSRNPSRPRSKAALNLVRMLENGTRKPQNLVLVEACTTTYLRHLTARVRARSGEVMVRAEQTPLEEFMCRWRFQVAPYKAQHWYICGKLFSRMARWSDAAACFRKAVATAQGSTSLEPTAKDALSLLAAIDCDTGHPRRAERVFRELLPYYAATNNTTKQCDILHSLAICAYSSGDSGRALPLARQALRQAREHNYAYGIAAISNFLGGINAAHARFAAAHVYFDDAIVIARRLGDLRGLAATLSNLGDLLVSEKRYLRASRILFQALDYHRKLNDFQGQSTTQSKIGKAYVAIGDNHRARNAFTEQLRIDRICGDLVGQVLAHLNLALVGEHMGGALNEVDEAGEIADRLGDKGLRARVLKSRGSLLAKAARWSEAANCFRRSLRLQREIGYDADGLSTFFHLAECLQELGRRTEALRLMDTAFLEARGGRLPSVGWSFRLQKALILKDQGHIQACLELLRCCRRSGRRRGDFELLCQADLNIALADADKGRYAAAERRLRRLLSTCLQTRDREQLGHSLYALAQISTKRGDMESAARSHLIGHFVWTDPAVASYEEYGRVALSEFAKACSFLSGRVSRQLDRQRRRLSTAVDTERIAETVSPDWLPRSVVRAVREIVAREQTG
jgi:tetratricopeptide (TPR) repeat protein